MSDETRPWHCHGAPVGTRLDGTGYRDYLDSKGRLRRYPDPRRNNAMDKLALRCANDFDTLRRMPHERVLRPRVDPLPYETPWRWRGFTTDEARHQAIGVLMRLLTWMAR